jgi:mRNA interferase MazF
MASILRGGIYWAELDPTLGREQSGRRPVLVLSEDVFNTRSGTVIAIALTSQEPRAAFPLTLEIIGSGFPKRSWAKVSQIRTLSVQRLGTKLGEATSEEVTAVVEGLNEILGA